MKMADWLLLRGVGMADVLYSDLQKNVRQVAVVFACFLERGEYRCAVVRSGCGLLGIV